MFLFWYRFPWITCYYRYCLYCSGFVTCTCLPFYREPSSGIRIKYIVLTLRRHCMIISVYINLLLGFLISFYFYYLQTLLVPFYIYIGQALLTSFCLFFTQKLFVLPFYSKIKYFCLTSYSMLITKLNLYATKPTIIAIKHEIKLLAIIFSSVNTKFGLMTYKVILTSSPIQQGIIKCLILICFAIFKNGDIVNFYPYILESSGRGMSIEDLLNPISTGG